MCKTTSPMVFYYLLIWSAMFRFFTDIEKSVDVVDEVSGDLDKFD